MLSIGEIINRIVIENIKIAMLKEKVWQGKKGCAEDYKKMMGIDKNCGVLENALEEKIERVISGEKNRTIKNIKTYRQAH